MPDNRSSTASRRKDRKFAVSANRGQASHRVRYVETGGALVDTEECTFCQSVPDLQVTEKEKATGDEPVSGGQKSSD
ncbi:hypothetical protein MD273_07635 [Marinobacter pelagius]|uniref:hypothetical protein n=1 Tax=Marinobacter sp. C7 TaxID=2951363 RepID=UPI001EF0F5F9|nr:hypothetical protein [Marinobacter sp. C7]MCG7199592.1 hypothetical protein [Marinobacter sp. C7]